MSRLDTKVQWHGSVLWVTEGGQLCLEFLAVLTADFMSVLDVFDLRSKADLSPSLEGGPF